MMHAARPLFISFGPELGVLLVLIGLALLIFMVIQLGTLAMAIRAGVQRRWGRAMLWGVACFLLVGAVPLWQANTLRIEEATMERLRIVREVPDFTGKTVLYIPARSLDDPALSCIELVELSGASVVYLAERWVGIGQPERTEPVPFDAPVNLLSLVRGEAEVVETEFGPVCQVKDAPAPDRLDFVLLENKYENLIAPFRLHMKASTVTDFRVNLAYFIGAPDDARAFVFSPETALVALFDTYARPVVFPYMPWRDNVPREVPRDRMEFERVIRQVVCREPVAATERTCWPFR